MKNSSENAAKRRIRMDSPVGPLVIESNGRAVCAIYNASAKTAVCRPMRRRTRF